jgi:hypothetical protein
MKSLTQSTKKILAIFAVFLCFGWLNSFAQEVGTKLDSSTSKLNVGQVVVVSLSIEPESNNAVYTVSANLVFDPTKLEFISATTDPAWLELNQPDMYITDTVNGLVVRTAGYPNGILGKANFVTYKFRAREAGDTRILIAAGQAYNDNNTNIGIKNTDLNLTILGDRVEAEAVEKVINVNIKVEADNAFYRQDPYAFTVYHKKEAKAQQAITKIWVFDEDWNIHFEDEKLWRTDMDNVLNFTIPEDTIEQEGNFRIIAKVRYEDGREFEVAEKDIGVLSNGKTWFTKNTHFFMPVFFLVVFVSIIHHFFVEREVYFKLRRYLKKVSKSKTKN